MPILKTTDISIKDISSLKRWCYILVIIRFCPPPIFQLSVTRIGLSTSVVAVHETTNSLVKMATTPSGPVDKLSVSVVAEFSNLPDFWLILQLSPSSPFPIWAICCLLIRSSKYCPVSSTVLGMDGSWSSNTTSKLNGQVHILLLRLFYPFSEWSHTLDTLAKDPPPHSKLLQVYLPTPYQILLHTDSERCSSVVLLTQLDAPLSMHWRSTLVHYPAFQPLGLFPFHLQPRQNNTS